MLLTSQGLQIFMQSQMVWILRIGGAAYLLILLIQVVLSIRLKLEAQSPSSEKTHAVLNWLWSFTPGLRVQVFVSQSLLMFLPYGNKAARACSLP